MNARVFGGVARTSRSLKRYRFSACDLQVPWPWVAAGGANGSRLNGAGEVAAASAPRINVGLGLLVEEARDNLVQRSEALATSPWVFGGALTVTNASTTAKGLSFSRLSGGLNLGILYQDIAFTGDGTKCFSLFVKKDGAASGVMNAALYDSTAGVFRGGATITVAGDGVVTAASSSGGVILGVEPWGDGVYRVLVQAAGIIAANNNRIYASDSGGATISSVLLSGVQPENGSFPTTYIPTTSAAVTRSADSLTCTDLAALGLDGPAGTVSVRFIPGPSGYRTLLDGSASANQLYIMPGGHLSCNGAVTDNTVVPGEVNAAVLGWDATGTRILLNNGPIAASANAWPAPAQITIGVNRAGGEHLDGLIAEVATAPRLLSAAEFIQEVES